MPRFKPYADMLVVEPPTRREAERRLFGDELDAILRRGVALRAPRTMGGE
jgi:hypothetical protein